MHITVLQVVRYIQLCEAECCMSQVLFQGWSLPFCESLWGQMSRVPDQPTTTTDHPITLPPALEMGTLYAVLIFVFLILFMYLISR
ncbi:unnamed protein product [Dicrocoelium dendriticum]|nr:unnamed protein product [Dicrocoelium dendriticum]